MERKWSLRQYREGGKKGVLELWKAVYPEGKYDQEHWLRWWCWMYKQNPAGTGKIFQSRKHPLFGQVVLC